MSGKGGGSVGAVSFATYLENTHQLWLGMTSESSPQGIDFSVVDLMNAAMSGGQDGTISTCVIVAIAASAITTDEGFTITDNSNDDWVFKFNKDGGGVSGEDFSIVITTGFTNAQVANAINGALIASNKFTTDYQTTYTIVISQLFKGANGNRVNSDDVTDADFVITNFGGGTDDTATNPYFSANVYDPDNDITAAQTEVTKYVDAVAAMAPDTDWQGYTSIAKTESVNKYPTGNVAMSTIIQGIVTEAITDAATTIDTIREGVVGDINSLMNSALTQLEVMLTAAPVKDMIAEYQRNAETAHLRSVSRYAGGMAEINAVQSSAYLIGMALMEAEHVQSVDQFSAQLSLQLYNTIMSQYFATHGRYTQEELGTFVDRFNNHVRTEGARLVQNDALKGQMINKGAMDIASIAFSQIDHDRLAATVQADMSRTKIIAKNEELKQGVLYDAEDWLWDLKVYQYGSNVLSGISTGGQVLPESPSQMSTTLSGAMAGAAVGATLGPQAAVAGGVIGGIGGFLEGI